MNQKRTLFAGLLVTLCLPTAMPALEGGAESGEQQADAALLAARQKFFGAEYVNARTGRVAPDKVIFSWLTNSSLAVSLKGHVILLDTYVHRAETAPGRTPFVVEDLVSLQPEAMFLGHGHYDHADNAAYIAGKLGIPIYASEETCNAMRDDAKNLFSAGNIPVPQIDCRIVTSLGSTPGSEIVNIDMNGVACITAFRHLHSTTVPKDTDFTITPVNNIADPRDAAMYPPGTPLSYPSSGNTGPGGPISIFFQFVVPGKNHFTFVWHNTSGAIKEGCGSDKCWGGTVGQQLIKTMQGLPPTDVELGSLISLGYAINGMRDPILYLQAIHPKVYIPLHQGVVALPTSSLEFKIAYFAQLDNMNISPDVRPEARWLVDPNDYLKPLVYDPEDARWSKRGLPQGTVGSCR